MRVRTLTSLALALALFAGDATARADDQEIYTRLLAQKAAPIVTVKLVLNLKMNMMGQTREQEFNLSASGVVVDKSGLVMIPNAALNPFTGGGRRGGRAPHSETPTATPVSIRVIFPGDTNEYDAVLGAKDSKLGLAFLLIRDLAGKAAQPLGLETASPIHLGQTLYSVVRLGQGFDDAPAVYESKVVGKVTKPREMWVVEGNGTQPGRPLYDASGAVAGVMIAQEGVGDEEAGRRAFLLPLDVAQRTIATSLEKAKAELDRILEEEEEAAAKKGDAEKKDGDKKDDAEKKDDGKKDEGAGSEDK